MGTVMPRYAYAWVFHTSAKETPCEPRTDIGARKSVARNPVP